MSEKLKKPLKYALFMGCFIPTRFPQLEMLAREILPEIGIELTDVEGFSCCPEPVRFRAVDSWTWLVMASRNLSVAQKAGLDILTLCPGCTLTLSRAAHELANDPELTDRVNEVLKEVGHGIDGPVKVRHMLRALYEDLGPEALKKAVKRPLNGLRIAAHSGCHEMNPPEILGFGNPLNPKKTDVLIEALGAEAVDYNEKALCCGYPLTLAGSMEESLTPVARKISDINRFGADGLAVSCASCFQQYETGQMTAARKGLLESPVPVFHFLELLALAMGRDLNAIGFNRHKVKGDPKALEEKLQSGAEHVS